MNSGTDTQAIGITPPAYQKQPITNINIEKIENGYLVKANGIQVQPFGRTVYVKTLNEIAGALETIFSS